MWSPEEKLLDDILRCVVCCCGNYRHHGVDWMPEGSGEARSDAVKLVQAFVDAQHAVRITEMQQRSYSFRLRSKITRAWHTNKFFDTSGHRAPGSFNR